MTPPAWLDAFIPAPTALSWKQRGIIVAGVLVGIGLTALICGFMRLELGLSLWLMAPLGASAAQVFAVPGSPMSQPWPIVAGHAFSALAGLAGFYLFGHTSLACAVAVALAMALMLQFRCLHPSGGGTALFVVVSQTTDWGFILFPVTINAAVLVATAVAWHRLTGHTYPQPQGAPKPLNLALHRFEPADLENALTEYNQALSISRAEVEALIEQTEMQAYRRMARGLTCADIMTRRVHTIDASLHLKTAEKLMQRQDVNVLPVTDRERHVQGLLRMEAIRDAADNQKAGDVMMTDYFRRRPDAPATELLDLFAHSDRRYVVILDDQEKLAGLISKSDLMRALFHAG